MAHPNLFQNPLHTEVGPQPLGRITGHTAEGGPIRENPPQLGQIAPEAKPGQLGKIKSFQPSEKAATMSAPRKVVPEQEGHNFDEQLQLAKKIVGDPNATAEEKRVAQGRIDQSEEVQKNYRKKPAEWFAILPAMRDKPLIATRNADVLREAGNVPICTFYWNPQRDSVELVLCDDVSEQEALALLDVIGVEFTPIEQ